MHMFASVGFSRGHAGDHIIFIFYHSLFIRSIYKFCCYLNLSLLCQYFYFVSYVLLSWKLRRLLRGAFPGTEELLLLCPSLFLDSQNTTKTL